MTVNPDDLLVSEPLVNAALLGNHDAMVIMRSKTTELCFLMRRDMTEEAFIACCKRLRELTLP